MVTDLEKRVAALEHDVSDVKQLLVQAGSVKKDWKQTVGMSKDDSGFDEMIELGRAIREAERQGDS
ncbi:MAG: hypothetical protein ABI614_06740 [Planctomycetota bacterium]